MGFFFPFDRILGFLTHLVLPIINLLQLYYQYFFLENMHGINIAAHNISRPNVAEPNIAEPNIAGPAEPNIPGPGILGSAILGPGILGSATFDPLNLIFLDLLNLMNNFL